MNIQILIITICIVLNSHHCVEQPYVKDCRYIGLRSIVCDQVINRTTLPLIPLQPKKIAISVHYMFMPCLPDNIFEGYTLRTLNLKRNYIEYISNSSFSKITSLSNLYLSQNNIKHVDFVFENNSRLFSELRIFGLSDNRIEFLKNTSFAGFKKLEYLYLRNNLISSIEPNTFRSVIFYLDLAGNKLNDIDNIFQEDCSLQTLILKSNNISLSNSSVPEGLSSLLTLSLSDNNINEIDKNMFKNLKKLSFLDVSENNLTAIDDDLFKKFRFLRKIDIQKNQLESIDLSIFNKNFMLRLIFCEYNSIRLVRNNSMTNLASGTIEVYLRKNRIEDIQDNAFITLPYLAYLGLDQNSLKQINNNTFNGLSFLSELNLEYNNIRKIEHFSFKGLNNLVHLDICNNQIESIDFYIPEFLQTLYIHKNLVSFLSPASFADLQSLNDFQLTNNRIKILPDNVFSLLRYLGSINLFNNSISELGRKSLPITYTNLNVINLEFNSIKILKSFSFLEVRSRCIDLSNNEIEVIEADVFNGIAYIQNIYLRNNFIRAIFPGAFNNITNLEALDLSQNKLTSLESFQFNLDTTKVLRVKYLSLQVNDIKLIKKDAFSGVNIQRLFLNNNPIKSIDPEMTNDLSLLSEILVSKSAFIKVGVTELIRAFKPKQAKKRNIYTYYKAVFLVVEGEMYSDEFCKLILQFIKNNIHLNIRDADEVNKFLNECLSFVL